MSKKNKNKQRQQVSEEQLESVEPIQEESEWNDLDNSSIEQESSQQNSEYVESQEQSEIIPPTEEDVLTEEKNESLPEISEKESSTTEEIQEPIKEEPKQEIKSTNKPRGVLIVEKRSAKATTVVPETVVKFNELADKYLAVMTKAVITPEDRQKAVMILTKIAQYVTTSTDVRVFDACFKFMLKNRQIMLVPEVVMDGFYKYCDKTKITKITQFYVTFQSLVQSQLLGDRFMINPTTIRRVFNNDALANWLILKKK